MLATIPALSAATWLMLSGTSSAMPAGVFESTEASITGSSTATAVAPDITALTALWTTVNDRGRPITVTPVLTTIDGTPTVISAAPVPTSDDEIIIDDELPPFEKTGSGAFEQCHNKDGPYAPFCEPSHGQNISINTDQHITWDPEYFGHNTSIKIVAFYDQKGTDQAFATDYMSSGWGYYEWKVKKNLFSPKQYKKQHTLNITIGFGAKNHNDHRVHWVRGPTVTIVRTRRFHEHKNELPDGAALYIGIPAVVGFVLLVSCGTCLMNRKLRRIGVGSVMGRGKGYNLLGKGKKKGLFGKKNKDEGIRLMGRDEFEVDDRDYRDTPDMEDRWNR
ncbi:hypothetical protein QR685DRAFT_321200 [Neurospora intermedia]|uniref:Uncharacterized protein n=1 Tax=Neurospora intermedia TaxID=5142 RepID=A0ABR3D8G8_NEUIN